MTLPVPLVVGHHQGDGAPSDAALDALATPLPGRGHYTYGIGLTRWTRYLDDPTAPYPGGDASTGGHNRTSMGIVLTGNRSVYPLTLADQVMLGEIGRDARARGFVGAAPQVLAHRSVPGNFTECCGNLVAPPFGAYKGDANAWLHFEAAFLGTAPTTGGDDVPADNEVVDYYSNAEGAWALEYGGGVRTLRGPFYGSYFTLPSSFRNDPARRFLGIGAPTNGVTHGYGIVSLTGEAYDFTTKQ